jgi:preprotein translocase subunit YajC
VPEIVSLLPLVGIALLFWLLLIRPAAKRQKELARMQSSLKPGDEVMLTSGILGTLRDTDGEHLRLEIADGVIIRVARGAVGSVVQPKLVEHEPEES